jgi:RHH-type proline utilization regulon transcriptional repressor/proline dehydrogenase/delta 1-pyrroline-5-carboxylate dehydrogenase
VREAGKTMGDAWPRCARRSTSAATTPSRPRNGWPRSTLPGPTGESNELRLHGRGVFVCISPWNFPLAIFAGQVVAALVAGNTVAAKPAEQTPRRGPAAPQLLHEAGVPADALQLLHGPGETVGAAAGGRPAHVPACASPAAPQVARLIQRTWPPTDGPIVPLIAETGGLNAMIVDSTALPEQVVDAVVHSAPSARRPALLGAAPAVRARAHRRRRDRHAGGAMAELRVGDRPMLATDVGPVIDAEAHAHLSAPRQRLQREARLLGARR